MRDTIGELWVIASNTHRSLFPRRHLCVLNTHNLKVQVVCRRWAYPKTALLSKTLLAYMHVVLFRVVWEIRLESYIYGSIHPLGSFSDAALLCVYCKPMYTSLFANKDVCIGLQCTCCHVMLSCVVAHHVAQLRMSTTALVPTINRFVRTSFATYSIHVAVSFQLQWTL